MVRFFESGAMFRWLRASGGIQNACLRGEAEVACALAGLGISQGVFEYQHEQETVYFLF